MAYFGVCSWNSVSLPLACFLLTHLRIQNLLYTKSISVLLISIIRIPSLIYYANSTDITCSYSPFHMCSSDPSVLTFLAGDDVSSASWSNVECNVAIVCASLPTLRALLKRHIPNLVSSTVHRTQTDLPSHSTTLSMDAEKEGNHDVGQSV